ncbi:MAG: 50S ribosomal protein L4 [Clostridia bacterium]
MEINVLNTAGKTVGKMDLNDEIFNREYNEALIHQSIVAQLANRRQGTKSTLTRSEVRGGGVKPYRQKGTGRARQGSIRAPQFIKGGVVFAPKPRDFSKKVNKFAKRLALLSALSEKFRTEEALVVDKFEVKEAKTKEIVNILKTLNLTKSTLLVLAEDDGLVLRAANNLEKVDVINASLLNVYDIVKNANCLFTQAAILKIEEANA